MFRKLIFALVTLALLLSACAAPAAPAPTAAPPTAAPAVQTISLTDGLGRTVKLAGPAQRIITLAPSNT